jgi:hypothetical protein
MWHYDWTDGWEWFFDAFYNDRYYPGFRGVLWAGRSIITGTFTHDPAGDYDFATWTAVGSTSDVIVSNVDFNPWGSTGLCYSPGGDTWVASGSISADVVVLVADIYSGSYFIVSREFAEFERRSLFQSG